MTLGPQARKWALIAHIVTSLGWVGAVAAFLVLTLVGMTSHGPETMRASYIAMNLVGKCLIAPLSMATLAIGLVEALGTPWGLFRHRWVLVKFILTVVAAALALQHIGIAGEAARIVSETPEGVLPQVGGFGSHLAVAAGGGLLLLIAIAAVSVLKPWGLTGYGRRVMLAEQGQSRSGAMPVPLNVAAAEVAEGLPRSLKVFAAVVGTGLFVFALMHHLGGHGTAMRHFMGGGDMGMHQH